MCCDFGDGSYILVLFMGEVLVFGGDFEEQEVIFFCVGDSGDGCMFFNDLQILEMGYFYVYLVWFLVGGGVDVYWICFKIEGQIGWIIGNWFMLLFIIWGNMQFCCNYEFQVQLCCDGVEGEFLNLVFFFICGCEDVYCYFYGIIWDDWIVRVQFKEIDYEIGKFYGFGDYMDLFVNLEQGVQYLFMLMFGIDDN